MAEEEAKSTEADAEVTEEEEAAPEKQYSGEKIMCFVSKKMVPIEDTVELEIQPHKKVRVLPRYIKYDQAQA